MKGKFRKIAGFLVGAFFLLAMQSAGAETPPYPSSTIITNLTWLWKTHERRARGSDNWPVTWADNGHQYTAWGDGGGFGGNNKDGRVSLGVARIEGAWDDYAGYNVWGGKASENAARFGGKSYGIVCIDGALFMWVGPGSNATSYREARLYRSADYGASWRKADWAFLKTDGIIMPTICNFGQDYANARDDYVYHYFIHMVNRSRLAIQKPGKVYLARVPKDRIMAGRSEYEWVSGFGAGRAPMWTSDISRKVPVFQDANGVGWCMSVSYNPKLQRYLLCTENSETGRGRLGIFDAPEPWGPWTTVGYYDNWGSFGSTFYWSFSNKWLSEDGKKFTVVFTGKGKNDSWNTVRGCFLTKDEN